MGGGARTPTVAAALGVVLLAALWLGPLPALAHGAFTAHMVLHVGVVALAAPLIALGLAGGTHDPVGRWPAAFPALAISALELLVVWGWHAPALHRAARGHAPVMALEQASFLAVGLLLWLSVLGGGPELRRERRGAGVLALLLTSMHMTFLGALLVLAQRPLYHLDGSTSDALRDQQIGGTVMLVVGGAVYLFGGLALTRGLIGPQPASRPHHERAR